MKSLDQETIDAIGTNVGLDMSETNSHIKVVNNIPVLVYTDKETRSVEYMFNLKTLKRTKKSPIKTKLSIDIIANILQEYQRDDLLLYHIFNKGIESRGKKSDKCDNCGVFSVVCELTNINANLCEPCYVDMELLQEEKPKLFKKN